MTQEEIRALIDAQRAFFRTGKTLDPAFRAAALKRLRAAVRANEGALAEALRADLGKSPTESYMCEVGLSLSELSYMIRHAPALSRERRVRTPLAQYASRSYRKPSPYGTVLIMSPWNYPVLLALDPLTDALAAGNTAILKPSAYSPHTSAVLDKLIRDCFDPGYVAVVTGGRRENSGLLDQKFDYIFFTGSKAVGREVLRRAAEDLTPVTLELGGKSPCLVDRTADLKLAARRIVFGKFLNCGQTCVAPDYLYCDETVKDALLVELKAQIAAQFGKTPLDNENYGRIVNEKHFDRISGLIDPAKVVLGGEADRASLRIAPTVLDGVDWTDPVMGEEIFGPVLPVLTFRSLEEAVEKIAALPHPLALYLFSSDRAAVRSVTAHGQFGAGCVNDVVVHRATTQMPFGGVGESGMGGYHGKAGFDTFSHTKSIVDKRTWLDLPMRYQPYRTVHDRLIRLFLR